MRFSVLTILPLALTVAEETKKTRLLRRGGDKTQQLYDVAAPTPPGAAEQVVVKAVEEVNKAKEDEALWERLLGETSKGSYYDPWYGNN